MSNTAPQDHRFHVDLRGMIDLLSHHMYSSPRVFVRELLQNAVDAVTAAGAPDRTPDRLPQRPDVVIRGSDASWDGAAHFLDAGVGLSEADLHEFMSTIGRSSKRDEWGLARTDQLGRFGIGLLSCFMATGEIEVVSRKDGHHPVRWVGREDGSYRVDARWQPEGDDPRAQWLADGTGTCVRLAPAHEREHWLTADTLISLARDYGALLPRHIVAEDADGVTETLAPVVPAWRVADPQERREALAGLAAGSGVEVFHTLPVAVPEADLDGVVLISGSPVASHQSSHHVVYLNGMLLSTSVADLLPDWAFFARAVVTSTMLSPTASREALHADDLSELVRSRLGDQIRQWLTRLATDDPDRLAEFAEIHNTALRGVVASEPDLVDVLMPVLAFETNEGWMTWPRMCATTDVVRMATTIDDFRQVSAVAAAQGMLVVCAGYAWDVELLRAMHTQQADARLETLDPLELQAHTRTLSPERARATARTLAGIRAALAEAEVDVELRTFLPESMSALYLHDALARQRRQDRDIAAEADDLWSDILAATDDGGSDRPLLILNDRHPTVRRLTDLPPDVRDVATRTLYCQALMAGRHRLRPQDRAMFDTSLSTLLTMATEGNPT